MGTPRLRWRLGTAPPRRAAGGPQGRVWREPPCWEPPCRAAARCLCTLCPCTAGLGCAGAERLRSTSLLLPGRRSSRGQLLPFGRNAPTRYTAEIRGAVVARGAALWRQALCCTSEPFAIRSQAQNVDDTKTRFPNITNHPFCETS